LKYLPITEVCDFQGGSQPPKSEWSTFPKDGYIRMLQIRDFTQRGKVEAEFVKDSSRLKKCNHEDILIGRYGASVGKVLTGLSGAYNVAIIRAIPDQSQLEKRYLYYCLKSPSFQSFIMNVGGRAAQAGFNKADLKSYLIPVLPLKDQKCIAHLLGKVENLINERKQNLKQLDELLKSVFLDRFGPQAEGYDYWPLVEIKDLAERRKGAMRTGPFGSNLLHSEFTQDGSVAVLGIDNAVKNTFSWDERRYITDEKYEELRNYRIYPGDVIVTIMGTIGRSAVIPDDIPLAINTKHLAAITLDKNLANPIFISYSIHSSPYILNQFKSKNRGAIMSGLNLGIIKETKLKRPPIELQNNFSEIYKKVDGIKDQYKSSLSDLQLLYDALSQQAFKGELDLSRVNLTDEVVEPSSFDKLQQSIEVIDRLVPEPIRRMNEIINKASFPFIQRAQEFKALHPFPENIHRMIKAVSELPEIQIFPFSHMDLFGFKDPKARPQILEHWFGEWLADSQTDELNLERFWQRAQRSLVDYLYEEDLEEFEFSVEDYDVVKGFLFQAINDGLIKQTTDTVQLKDDNVAGNRVVLVKG
jgi:type I restriction enzyme S subunit